jgi:FMN phosphatase YigB (HAD superfamily)
VSTGGIRHVIFDLSETLISGLIGVERVLASELGVPEESIWPSLGRAGLYEFFKGRTSERAYLEQIIRHEGWPTDVARLKAVIRANFHHEVDGSLAILADLARRYEVALLSDHGREWVAYIRTIHSFFDLFGHTFFSFDLGSIKKNPATFRAVLDALPAAPEDCLFIDDSPTNVQVAGSVGIPGIRFESARQLAAELARRGML